MDRSQSKQLLLIADANPENVNVLKTILTPDYDISVAADAEETIRLASSPNIPGLILLSNMMATADAYEVCRKLKAGNTTRDIPIVLLTEPTTGDTEAEGFELGAADYLTTPFKRSVVRARIRTHLELKRYRDNFENKVKKRVSNLDEDIQENRDIEDTYRLLVENARDGIAIIHDFIVKYANPAFSKMTGLSEKELIGAHLKKFISEEEFIKNTTRYSERISGINLPRIYKSKIIHSDGYTIDVELNVCVVPYGSSLAALVFVRDIREEEAWKYLT
ncbi:MAG: PAS domain S-box protein [Deltaproteobacteria bacterium]|nr:PAS domain S-box protein [Deltaproteobacteria bacterium]